uniref:MATH domain-containing protein n=1 Tax=Trichogramma kaykai TaxID=54128 RepID=A0ABD2VUG6_9HYME
MFFPTGISGDDDFTKLYLVQCKYDEVEVSFSVTFLVDDKPVKSEKSISRKFNQRVKELGIQKVYRVQNVNELLSAEDVMTIRCELTVRV